MVRRSVNYCFIDYDEQRLNYRGITPVCPCIGLGEKAIRRNDLAKACEEYWAFVDDQIESGSVTGDDFSERRYFYDRLMTQGGAIADKLMDQSTKDQLWSLARSSDILYLVTGLLNVPWEALFNSDRGVHTFLSHECVLTRWPQAVSLHGRRKVQKARVNFDKHRLMLLDFELATFEHLGKGLRDLFKEDGEEVVLTSSQSALVDDAKTVKMVHWICEHEAPGLRLCKGRHYTQADTSTHYFSKGTVLILTSCQAGKGGVLGGGIAAGICAASNCTVIAPSSLVATHVGVDFARRLNALLASMDERPVTVANIWKLLQDGNRVDPNYEFNVTPEQCFALWYGIYGNADHLIKE